MARARSRKRRPAGARRAPANTARKPDSPAKASDGAGVPRGAGARSRSRPTSPTAPTYGERPRAPWHPLPLSELLILVGAIGAAIGFSRASRHGLSSGGPALFAGVGAVAIGTIEVTLREHRTGYRSHAVMLALLLVLVFHSAVVLGLSSITTVPQLLNVGLLAVDLALFAFLFKLLRARFLDARRERVFSQR
jgi:hypothetical protein